MLVSHQQQFFSELPSPGRSHHTNYWHSWVQTIYYDIMLTWPSLGTGKYLIVTFWYASAPYQACTNRGWTKLAWYGAETYQKGTIRHENYLSVYRTSTKYVDVYESSS